MLNNHAVTKYCYDVGQLVCKAEGKSTGNAVVSCHKGGKMVGFGWLVSQLAGDLTGQPVDC